MFTKTVNLYQIKQETAALPNNAMSTSVFR